VHWDCLAHSHIVVLNSDALVFQQDFHSGNNTRAILSYDLSREDRARDDANAKDCALESPVHAASGFCSEFEMLRLHRIWRKSH
jgi:hypothetical protein